MNDLFLKIINMSISASWLVLAVLLLRFVLKKAPKWVNVLLWGIVAVRLAFPFSIESALSLIPSAETVPLDIEMAVQPTINSGVPVINSMVNPMLSSFAPPQDVSTIMIVAAFRSISRTMTGIVENPASSQACLRRCPAMSSYPPSSRGRAMAGTKTPYSRMLSTVCCILSSSRTSNG